jgi:hypothetical protein
MMPNVSATVVTPLGLSLEWTTFIAALIDWSIATIERLASNELEGVKAVRPSNDICIDGLGRPVCEQ